MTLVAFFNALGKFKRTLGNPYKILKLSELTLFYASWFPYF